MLFNEKIENNMKFEKSKMTYYYLNLQKCKFYYETEIDFGLKELGYKEEDLFYKNYMENIQEIKNSIKQAINIISLLNSTKKLSKQEETALKKEFLKIYIKETKRIENERINEFNFLKSLQD